MNSARMREFMIIKIPFFSQSALDCGPTALRMVLNYLGKYEDLSVIKEKAGTRGIWGVYGVQLAVAAAFFGCKTDFFSKKTEFNEENSKIDYYKKWMDTNPEHYNKFLEQATVLGVNIQEKTLSLDELLGFVTEDSIPIVALDYNVLNNRGEGNYEGHFVPIIGDNREKDVCIYDSLCDEREELHFSREIFDRARKAPGTDESVVIVHRR